MLQLGMFKFGEGVGDKGRGSGVAMRLTRENRALEILKSASKYGKNVKAIAVTGSVNAITTGADVGTRDYNSSEWLPVRFPFPFPFPTPETEANETQLSIADAIAAQNAYYSYCVAKAEAEKAIWKYVSEEKPHYNVSVLLPALIFGPPIQPIGNLKKINYSNDV